MLAAATSVAGGIVDWHHMMTRSRPIPVAIALIIALGWCGHLYGVERVVKVKDDAGLRGALGEARAGTRIVVAPGKYRPGVHVANLRGTAEAPIVVEGEDAKDKPVFEGGIFGMHFSDCA